MSKSRTLSLALLILVGAACQRNNPPTGRETVNSTRARQLSPDVSVASARELAAGNQDFAFALYRETAQPGANYVASPFSIQQAFAMVYAGAGGDTATEIASTLHFGGEPDSFHAAMNAFDLTLTSRNLPDDTSGASVLPEVQLRVANALWGQAGLPWLEPYLDVLATNYGAGIQTIDFRSDPESARQTINAWVQDRTERRIRDLVPPGVINIHTAGVLTNAIHFSAPWHSPFPLEETRDGSFILSDGSSVTVPFMRHSIVVDYAVHDRWTAVEIPFRGEHLAMLIIVPTPGSFPEVDGSSGGEWLCAVVAALEPAPVDVALPRFSVETEFALSEAMTAMGMPCLTNGDCALTGILSAGDFRISEALHKAFILVNESGSEAAAATALVQEGSAPAPTVSIRADRPFYFAIRDRETELVIFWGRVMDPTQ